ncbi:related to UTP14-subunit of U3-containing small subunit processome complex [Sporisorium scitamineum]|uniref:Related to UTP14-subunit of U3-containing small subunit processome complex n=1 Tax=Sporisorium scitamineum TaxID=49012 RepID=A0A127ZBX2_9BASI|nr:related to UTP14-subunit of U3-containing small subunit processome complex [Sporisorium scitamineum]
MARQRGSRSGASSSTPSAGRAGSRRGGGKDSSAPFSSAAYSSGGNKSRRTPRSSGSNNAGPKGLHDVYDFAQASTSASSKQGRGARRALAGMQADDYADLPSKAKGKQRRRRGDDDDGEEEEGDSDDSDAAPIGPKVFDSEDELNASIEGSDEELDSDEAFGDHDEEKFEGWTFGRGGKSNKRKSNDADDDEEGQDGVDDDGQDDGMMDLSRMLDSASESSEEDDADNHDNQDASDDENDQSSSKLAKHIESFAAGSKRTAHSDSEAGSDAEPSTKRSRRVLSERTEAIPETEFAAAHSGSTLRLEDLMHPLSSNIDFADVRKNTKLLANSKKGGGALSAPLPSVVQDRLDRQGAYSITRDEVQGWQPTINRLRDAEHLSFPLQKPAVTKASTSGLVATFHPDNDMEASIAAMLTEGGLTEKQLAQQEDLAMNKLDPEEARARRDELRRMRMLMFRAEQKAKRVSKIKSKAYRKIHRKEKERLKEQMKELGEDVEEMDSEEEMEERLKAERDRARERATLKHKNTSKWAKNILSARHGEHNQEARNEIDAQLRRGAELRSKIQRREFGDDSELDDYSDGSAAGDSVEDSKVVGDAFDELEALEAKEAAKRKKDEEEFEHVGGKMGVYSMKFMKDARERQYAKIQGEVDDFLTEMQGLGADGEDEGKSDGDDVGEAVIARKGKEAEVGGSSVYVQGNKGRAVYGTTAPSPAAAAQNKPAGKKDDSKPSSSTTTTTSIPPINSTSGNVEIGGTATITKPTPQTKPKPTKPTLTSPATPNDDDDDDDDATNPWLTISSTNHHSTKLSRKKNDSSLSTAASTAAASKSALRASKTLNKSTAAKALRHKDETIAIDLASRLGNDRSSTYESASDAEEEEPSAVVGKKSALGKAGGGGKITAMEQRELVADAFASDDVVSEFLHEKAAIVEADSTKFVDTRLPGWGSWTGRGTHAPRHPPSLQKIQGINREKRKDANLTHVIISERRDKHQDKYRPKDLPYPFTSVAQYQASLAQPLGKEWNTRIETQRLNLPKVTKKVGKVIRPVVRKF